MRSRIAIDAAATALLFLGTVGANAGEAQFQAPSTDRARETQAVLARAAEALNAGASLAAGEHISGLWLFPTPDDDTVFAQYVVSGGQASSKVGGSQKHLELLTVSDGRIVGLLDLTRAGNDGASHTALDRTAFVGTGHAVTSSENSGATRGVPASAHWSAAIGTGHVSGDSVKGSEASAHQLTLAAPLPHWTSRIGTGHAAQSSTSVQDGAVRLTAGE